MFVILQTKAKDKYLEAGQFRQGQIQIFKKKKNKHKTWVSIREITNNLILFFFFLIYMMEGILC